MSPSEVAADGLLTARIEGLYGAPLATAYPLMLKDAHRLAETHPDGETLWRISREGDPLDGLMGRSLGYGGPGSNTGSEKQIRLSVHLPRDDGTFGIEEPLFWPHGELFNETVCYGVPLELRKLYVPEMVAIHEWTSPEHMNRVRMAYGHVPDPVWDDRRDRAQAVALEAAEAALVRYELQRKLRVLDAPEQNIEQTTEASKDEMGQGVLFSTGDSDTVADDSHLDRIRHAMQAALPDGMTAVIVRADDETVDDSIIVRGADGDDLPYTVQVGDGYLGLSKYNLDGTGQIASMTDLGIYRPDEVRQMIAKASVAIARHVPTLDPVPPASNETAKPARPNRPNRTRRVGMEM